MTRSKYEKNRSILINEEETKYFNATTKTNNVERKVGLILEELRRQEIEDSVHFFPPQHNFRVAQPFIDVNSRVLQALKGMPKGGLLHIHMLGDTKKVIEYATYRNDCYINTNMSSIIDSYGGYHFANSTANLPSNGDAIWTNVVEWRQQSNNVTSFDNDLYEMLQFYSPLYADCHYSDFLSSPVKDRSDDDEYSKKKRNQIPQPTPCMTENSMWEYFDGVLGRIGSLQSYLPVFHDNVLYAMQQLVDDNIQYVELRAIFGEMYDEYGNTYKDDQVVQIWLDTLNEFNQNSDKKLQMKFIYSSIRSKSNKTIWEEMQDCLALQAKFPEYIIGYDLVDEEDRYHSLYYYLDDFLNVQEQLAQQGKSPLKFYFHAGETDWSSKYNLYDALLLNVTRIGHGYSLDKYPKLVELARKNQVAIEICPISNQMLLLLLDLRTHPAISLMHNGVPIVISSDDPIIYNYAGVTYDFYEAWMAWGLDISSLKQIALNSLIYTGMSEQERTVAIQEWQSRWDQWLNEVLQHLI